MSDAIRTSCVQFSKDVASTGEDDIEDLELQSFVRHNTPHPKDLKARHPKMFPTPEPAVTTGPVPVHPVTTRLTPDVAPGDTPTCGIAQRAQAAPVSPPTLPANSANPVHSYPSPAYANVVAKPISGAVSGADPPTSYAHERHVGFSDDEDADADVEPEEPDVDVGEDVGEDGEEESVKRDETETKLRRRDTPHHLKNKRVTGAGVATTTTTASTAAGDSAGTAGLTATSISDRQRVADILAKNAAAASASASASASSRTLASPSSPPDHDYENGEDLYRQHTIVITRNVGQGLGISIAGGKGSAAYIGDDEVLSRPKCEYFSVGSTLALGVL